MAHFFFSTGCTSVTQVSLGMETEMDLVSVLDFAFGQVLSDNLGPAAKFARSQAAKKAAVNYFTGNSSRANCDHVQRF